MTCISIDGKTEIYGIVGNPVDHSFSPKMQTLAFQAIGENTVYLPFPTEEKQLPRLLEAFRLIGVRGFNVTVPFKEKIVPFLDRLSREAEILGSVNTVVGTDEGWKGYSTDGSGFVRSLSEAGVSLAGKSVVLVGAGGGARSIALSLASSGVGELHILNRTLSKAEKIAGMAFKVNSGLSVSTVLEPQKRYDILINSTSVGMHDRKSPVPDSLIDVSAMVVDIIYNPPQTLLLQKAVQKGIPCNNGLDMLLYQGVEAFEIWTGKKAPVETMKTSLLDSIESLG